MCVFITMCSKIKSKIKCSFFEHPSPNLFIAYSCKTHNNVGHFKNLISVITEFWPVCLIFLALSRESCVFPARKHIVYYKWYQFYLHHNKLYFFTTKRSTHMTFLTYFLVNILSQIMYFAWLATYTFLSRIIFLNIWLYRE